MTTKFKIALAVVAGAAFGAAAVQGLHAQAKPKAYTVTEMEVLDAAAAKEYTPLVQAAQKAAGAGILDFRTADGRVVALEGTAPKRVSINEWDSLSRHRHSTTRRPSRILRRSATRQSRSSGGTSSRLGTRRFPGVPAFRERHDRTRLHDRGRPMGRPHFVD